jgi:hypothetical protein
VAGANLANSDHMGEEEREGLTDFRRLASLTRRHQLAVAFAAFEARNYAGVQPVDKDPATYVVEAEAGELGSRSGSPSTGSPSTGSPSAGSPSTGSPSAGSPSTGSPSAGSLSIGSLKRN